MAEMVSLNQEDLDELLILHENFQQGRVGGRVLSIHMKEARGLNFSGRNMTGADFTGAILIGSNFSKSKLNNAIFYGANLQSCNFEYSDLTNADLRGAVLQNANFKNSVLSNVDLRQGQLFGQKAHEAGEMKAVNAVSGETAFSDVNFSYANMEKAKLGKGVGDHSNMSHANLR